ncbi:MAG: long-chain fatty acid--CoA ligase, partial [Myxococcota bacterium]
IENLIKATSPMISQVVVHGDRRKYLSALITVDPDYLANFGKENGLTGDYAEMTKAAAVRDVVQAAINTANGQLARYETVKKFEILDKDFEVGDELTPTLKVKRKVCNQKYSELFNGMYDEAVAA